jgi:hypothetical protein
MIVMIVMVIMIIMINWLFWLIWLFWLFWLFGFGLWFWCFGVLVVVLSCLIFFEKKTTP